MIDLTQKQLEEVVISAGLLSNESLNDLIIVLATMRLVRRSEDADYVEGKPLHHVIIDNEPEYVIGIKICNCPACIKDMLGDGDSEDGDGLD